MSDLSDEPAAGWSMPSDARVWHYFPAGEYGSMCGRWMVFHKNRQGGVIKGPDDCVVCWRKIEADE